MKKSACLIALLFAIFSCEDKEPASPSCSKELTVLHTTAPQVHVGEELVIEGENICPEGLQSVTLNGITASVKSATATTITVIVPVMDAGTVRIKVTFTGFGMELDQTVILLPGTGDCNAETIKLQPGSAHSYTGDEWTITGEHICIEAVQAVTLNGINATIKTKSETSIIVEIPAMKSGLAEVKVSFTSFNVVLQDKLAVFPGNGTWKEVSPFPQTGRMDACTFASGGKAYVVSGGKVLKPGDKLEFEHYNNIYEYDPVADTWTFKLEDETFLDTWYTGYARWGKGFMYTEPIKLGMKWYDPVSNSIFDIGRADVYTDQIGFAIGDDVYIVSLDDRGYNLEIRKYNKATDKWPLLNTVSPGYASKKFFVPAAPFEHDGYGYFTTVQINTEKIVTLWRFDPQDNRTTKISTVATSLDIEFPGLEYMFTIDGLAYFIETGTFILEASSIVEPPKKLYIYNIQWNEWRVVDNPLPQTFYRPAAFTVDNRGFIGLGLNRGPGPSHAYPTEFYEFLPK